MNLWKEGTVVTDDRNGGCYPVRETADREGAWIQMLQTRGYICTRVQEDQ
jgi:hypothetical protein